MTPSAEKIIIRPEEPADYAAIDQVNREAFPGEGEANLVARLRRSPHFIPGLSLVAEKDGRIVGHILFSLVHIKSERGSVPAYSLAPMAVLPELQNQGIGSQLVRAGLAACRTLGARIVVVVGHPGYYPRFGFVPAMANGMTLPFVAKPQAFMVLELVPGASEGVNGVIEYPDEFSGLI